MAAAAAVALGGGAFALTREGSDDEPIRIGSTQAPGPPVVVDAAAEPASYRIVYRVEAGDAVSTDVVDVRRPFASRLVGRQGPPPGGKVISTELSAFRRQSVQNAGAAALVIAPPPNVASADVRVAPVLDDAVARGVLERRERRLVAGTPCQVYRSGQLLTSDAWTKAGDGEYADTCVDARGLILEDLLVAPDGDVITRRVATSVTPRSDVDISVGEPTVEVTRGGGSVLRITDDSRAPGMPGLELTAPPAGFARQGRYSVIPPQPEAFTDPLREGERVASVADVYVRGADLFVFDHGSTLSSAKPLGEPEGALDAGVEIDGKPARLLFGRSGAVVQADLGGGRYVRLSGTVPVAVLLDAARSLRVVPEGTLTFLEGPTARP